MSRLTSTRDWYPRLPRIERTGKLQPMSRNQHERLVSETAEQRKARLQNFEGPTGNSTPKAISPVPSPPCSQLVLPTVLSIMSPYRLPHGQYAYSGHVINLP